jgi:predicted AlkP superfamily phosphohydrolase/phosphomutase
LNREDLTKELRDATRDVLERMGLLDAVRKGRNMLFGEPESQASLDARLGAMTFKRSNIDRIIEAVDWSRTTVYALVPRGVRINLKGREPQGIVEPDEYESVRDRAIKALKGMAYPSGELVFDRVYRREDVLDGPYLDYAPDIITCMPVGVPSCHVDTREVFAVNRGATGSHTDWGVLIARGPGIRRATEIQGARLMDVTPTALMALGVPLNSDMDGVPLLDLFDDAFRAAHPVTRREAAATGPENRIDPFSVQEEEEILEHLKGLGYIN